MRTIFFAVMFVAFALADEPAATVEKGKVISLTDANHDAMTKNGGVWLVKYYAPWCGHCKKLAPTWEELAKIVNGVFNVAEVDCTANSKTCSGLSIRGYPTIKFHEPGLESPADVRVPRTVKSFVEFVENTAKSADLKGKIPNAPEDKPAAAEKPKEDDEPAPADSSVIVLKPDNIDAELAKGPILVKVYAPWCGHCKKLAPTWEELAKASGTGQFRVGKINGATHRELSSKFKIQGFPTVLFLSKDHDPVEFQGGRTVEEFTKFALEQVEKLKEGEKPHSEL